MSEEQAAMVLIGVIIGGLILSCAVDNIMTKSCVANARTVEIARLCK